MIAPDRALSISQIELFDIYVQTNDLRWIELSEIEPLNH